MRTARKNCLIGAGVVSIIMSAFFIMTFIFVLTDFDGLKQYVIELIKENNLNTGSLETNSFVNFTLVYFMISALIGVVFSVIYFKYSKYNYAQFLKCQKSLIIIGIINIVVGFALLPLIFILFALYMQPNEKEYESVKSILDNMKNLGASPNFPMSSTQNKSTNNTKILNEPHEKVFVNINNIQEEITKLRTKKANNEITDLEYEQKVNEILESNIKNDYK